MCTNWKKNKKSLGIHPLTIILAILLFAATLTWVIPAGEYERVIDSQTNREVVVAGTYHTIESRSIGPVDFVVNIQKGMINASNVVFLVLILGGAFGIFSSSGAVKALMAKVELRFVGKSDNRFVFPIIMLFSFCCAALFGMGEGIMILTPFMVSLSIALGYDAVTAVASLVLGVSLGYAASLTNPFNVGIAQAVVNLPAFSGLWYRLIIFAVIYIIAVWWVMRYAKRVKENPSMSIVADLDYGYTVIHNDSFQIVLTCQHKQVLAVFCTCLAFMIFALIKWTWGIDQLAAYFLVVSFLVGLANRYSFTEIADEFVRGAEGMLAAALTVAFASGIREILTASMILDSLFYWITIPLNDVPRLCVGPLMVLVQSIINMVIPSSSAMAIITMPIMAPLADIQHVQLQTAVIAYQFGDGITNLIMPFYSALIISLGLAKIPFQRWVKWILPLVGILLVVACVLTGIAEYVRVGPF